MVTQLDSIKRGPVVPDDDSVHDSNEQIKRQQKLKIWLRKKSVANILDAFDTTDIYEVGFEGKSSRITDGTTVQSRLFFELDIHGWGKV